MILNLIVARSQNNVIGKAGRIPWKIRGEQIQFKELTTGEAVVMGRNTYEDIGHKLPNRLNIVVSNTKDYTDPGTNAADQLVTVKSLTEAIDMVDGMEGIDLYVSGGRRLYEEAIPLVDRMYITEVAMAVEDDGTCVYFPEFNEEEFDRYVLDTVMETTPYTRTVYIRKTSKDKFCETGRTGLVWEDSKLAKGDIAKCHARIPGDIGTVTLSEKEAPSGRHYFTAHFNIMCYNGYRGFSGMEVFEDRYTSMDEIKADIHNVLWDMMHDKKDAAQSRMKAAERALYKIRTLGQLI